MVTGIVTPYQHIYLPPRGHCSSLGETTAAYHLDKKPNFAYRQQVTFPTCRNPDTKRSLPFDFQLFHVDDPEKYILVEIDGVQHSRFVEFFHRDLGGFEKQQHRDHIKNMYCHEQDIPLVRIAYDNTGSSGKIGNANIVAKLNEAIAKHFG